MRPGRVRGAVDIRDVAKKAGVSVGTVSRVVNEHPSVSAAKRQLVLAAIAELNYRPDAFARSLRTRSSDTIGVIIPDIRNPFFAELMHWIEIRARALGMSVLFVTSDEDPDAEMEQVEAFAARKVDGIVWAPSNRATRAPSLKAIPIIAVDRPIEGVWSVAADNRAGARLATRHLIDLGHERIACISGPRESATAALRLEGFLDVMGPRFRASGFTREDAVAFAEFDFGPGQAAAEALLSSSSFRPTAIVAGSDQQAIGALRAAADRGVAVPRELSVIGFDGVAISDLVAPRLTTIRQPLEKIAETAVAMAVGLEPRDAAAPRLFECELVVRDSTAPAEAAAARLTVSG